MRVPRVYWTYTRARVLTLEFIEGRQLADIDDALYSLEERNRLAEVIAEAWMTMVFRDGFFHGDPHPANILVIRPDLIGLVDFGLAGKLTDDDLTKATRLFIDVANENVDAIPKRLADLGVRYPKEREAEFRHAIRELYYHYYGAQPGRDRPAPGDPRSVRLIYSMNLRLPTRFIMLDKAIATLASAGVELYPDFNVFEVAKPYARSLLVSRFTPQRMLTRARRESFKLASIFARVPVPGARHPRAGARRADRGRLRAQGARRVHAEDRRRDEPPDHRVRRRGRADRLEPDRGLRDVRPAGARPERRLASLGFFLSGVLGLWLLWGVFRSGRI